MVVVVVVFMLLMLLVKKVLIRGERIHQRACRRCKVFVEGE